jgi:hypothetical protein
VVPDFRTARPARGLSSSPSGSSAPPRTDNDVEWLRRERPNGTFARRLTAADRIRQPLRMAGHIAGYKLAMRIGNTEVRFLGGPAGCLTMIVLSVLASVVLTVLLNLVL